MYWQDKGVALESSRGDANTQPLMDCSRTSEQQLNLHACADLMFHEHIHPPNQQLQTAQHLQFHTHSFSARIHLMFCLPREDSTCMVGQSTCVR
mmetsp:Transcript_23530/g.37463  ORF Transcript_23530/g.37463 Transcript_23530/m.37463 type:complete len:94 (-) Transcript_23530:406-687(-)